APTMQVALDNWEAVAPQLEEIYTALNNGTVTGFEEFEAHYCESPLPRAYQWADGSAYVNHVELVRKARGAEMPESFWTDPLMYQGGSDAFIGPCDNIEFASDEWGIDFEGEVAVVTGDVPMGASIAEAQESIRLIMLVNDISLRGLIPAELAKGFGFFQSKPSSAFSPVAVTPDELGDAWYENKVHLPLVSTYNHKPFGRPNAGVDMTFDFADLIVHATKTRPLTAGAIIGSGTVSNKQGTDHGTSIEEG
ncbi:fumarylacetoacetate hydrolase family protein, partial [Vibrio sp. YT-19(2023)]